MDKTWRNKFNISNIDHADWKQASTEDSLAVWAVKNQKINVTQYMEWATHTYNIPFLKDSFFLNIDITERFWNRVKDHEQWNEGFLPVYEWDGLLFSACLTPPEQTKNKNTIPVLTRPKNLQLFWNKIKKFSPGDASFAGDASSVRQTVALTDKKTGLLEKSSLLLNSVISQANITTTQVKNLSVNEAYSQILALSKKYFAGGVVFSYKNQEFTPVKWSDNLSCPTVPIKTEQASIFKMIVKSRSSYHGFIVQNEIHKQFFTACGFSALPKHITLIPVFDNTKNIIGAYMGIADKNLDKKILYKVSKWTGALTETLQKSQEQQKSSA